MRKLIFILLLLPVLVCGQNNVSKICKLNHKGTFTDKESGLKIEIVSVDSMEGGIEVFARAWKDGNQLGFGADGSVEIERFRIFNPPVKTDSVTENPKKALKKIIARNVLLVAKETTPIKGKIGHTTSTIYATVNRTLYGDGSWSSAHDATAGLDGSNNVLTTISNYDVGLYSIARSFFSFNTSGIPDADNISSATFSVNVYNRYNGNGSDYVNIYTANLASNTSVTEEDFDQGGTTKLSSDKDTYSSTGWWDFALNSTGLSNISKTSYTKFAVICNLDIGNNSSAVAEYQETYQNFYSYTTSGTTNDPVLVVVHSSPGYANDVNGVPAANISSRNGVSSANIDKINGK